VSCIIVAAVLAALQELYKKNLATDVIVNCVSFGITSTVDSQIQSGLLRTRVANCQLVSVKKVDFYSIIHQV